MFLSDIDIKVWLASENEFESIYHFSSLSLSLSLCYCFHLVIGLEEGSRVVKKLPQGRKDRLRQARRVYWVGPAKATRYVGGS